MHPGSLAGDYLPGNRQSMWEQSTAVALLVRGKRDLGEFKSYKTATKWRTVIVCMLGAVQTLSQIFQ